MYFNNVITTFDIVVACIVALPVMVLALDWILSDLFDGR